MTMKRQDKHFELTITIALVHNIRNFADVKSQYDMTSMFEVTLVMEMLSHSELASTFHECGNPFLAHKSTCINDITKANSVM